MQKHISPDFLISLIQNGTSHNTCRILAHDIPTHVLFDDCAKGIISPEEAAHIMMLQRESKYWVGRMFQWLWNFIR